MKKCAAVENCLEITICHLLIKAKQKKVGQKTGAVFGFKFWGSFGVWSGWVFGEDSLNFFDLSSDWILGVLMSLL